MRIIDKSVFKFLLVGVANTAVGAGTMFILYNLAHCSYWLSSAANYVVGGILSFFLNKFFTFQNQEKSVLQVALFVLNLALCYFIAYFCAKKAVYALLASQTESVRGNAALFCGMCLYTALNYFGQRFIVFRKKTDNAEARDE